MDMILTLRPGAVAPIPLPVPPKGKRWRRLFKSDGSYSSRHHDGSWFLPIRALTARESETVDEETGEPLIWLVNVYSPNHPVEFHAWLDEICEPVKG